MHDPLSREEIEDFYSYLKEIERFEHLTIPSKNYDILLDITLDEHNMMQWSYYYACHDTRCLFWLDRYDATYVTSELDGVESPAHLSKSQAFTIFILFSQFGEQGIVWNIFIGAWAISYWISSLCVDTILIGTTGLYFRSFLRVAFFHSVFMMNSWGSWPMAA
jgi:hypothetical protein